MAAISPDAPRCPQCQHPVTLNKTTCRGCGRAYHELCLKRGCTNGPDCGTAAASGGGGPGHRLALPFLIATIGLCAAYAQWRGRVTASSWFTPALVTGLVGMAAAVKLGGDPPEAARCRFARFSAWPLLVAALGAGGVAALGREVPYLPHLTALGFLGAALAVLGVLVDSDKRAAFLHVLCAAHLYLVVAVMLSPAFPRAMVHRLQAGGGAASGPAGGTTGPGAAGGGLGSLFGGGSPSVDIKGVMAVRGRKQAMTDSGSYGVGDTIPGAGVVESITDDVVVVRHGNGQVARFPVPH